MTTNAANSHKSPRALRFPPLQKGGSRGDLHLTGCVVEALSQMHLHALVQPHGNTIPTFLSGSKLLAPGFDVVPDLLLPFLASSVLSYHVEYRLAVGFGFAHVGAEESQVFLTQTVLVPQRLDKAFHRAVTAGFTTKRHRS